MRRTGKICIAAFAAAAVAAGSGFCYVKETEYRQFISERRFGNAMLEACGTRVDVSGLDAGEAFRKYDDATENSEIILNLNGDRVTVDIWDCYTRKAGPDTVAAFVDDITFWEWLQKKEMVYRMDDHVEYRGGAGEKAKEIIEAGEYQFEKAQDAYFDMDELVVIPEKHGTQINPEKAASIVEQAVRDGRHEIHVGGQDIYIQPAVSGREIEEKFAGVISILGWEAVYPDYGYAIRMSDYKDYIHINGDGSYSIDDSFLSDSVLELSRKVDKTYDSIRFKSVKDGEITVRGGTYGQIMDNAGETAFLKEKLKEGQSQQNRVPVWKCKPIQDGEMPDEYIEVDISEQHVWHFKDGKVHCEADCVTGTHSLHRDTPTGAYFISEKVNGKYLVGEGYRTWVNKWMRLTNSGIGLHDATWRARFGGSVYQTGGSHGCINLPLGFASKLYDESHVGMPVIVHQ